MISLFSCRLHCIGLLDCCTAHATSRSAVGPPQLIRPHVPAACVRTRAGFDAVSVLVDNRLAGSRADAVAIGNYLLGHGMIEHVVRESDFEDHLQTWFRHLPLAYAITSKYY